MAIELIGTLKQNNGEFGLIDSNDIIGGFVKVQSISFTNNYNATTQYDIYKSENMNLGLTTIVVT